VPVGGILLTGGASRRLGVDKATLVLDGETLAARAARILRACCEHVVEVGDGWSELPAVHEEPRGSGPLAALVAGAAALAEAGRDGVILLGCDLPFAAPVVGALAAEPGAGTVIPRDSSGRDQYVCARYSEAALREAFALVASGAASLRSLVSALPDESVRFIAGFDPELLADVDEPADAARIGIRLPR
jgi:molybdenum cofactor guanylyltransferase